MFLSGSGSSLSVTGNDRFPVNKGGLCLKGWTSTETLAHRDRLRSPLVRTTGGDLVEATWDQALDFVAGKTREIQKAHGRHAAGVFGGGSLTNEKAYLRASSRASHSARPTSTTTAASACRRPPAAAQRAFGLDRGLPFPLADIAQASVVLLVGANVARPCRR
jgi:assimilatory nitrate reductase catalytic subunit